MKIDVRTLRRLREERSWTQEHLATVSGLSLRTIQRIEREGNASADSRLALAGALQVDVASLAESAVRDPPPSSHRPDPSSEIHALRKHATIFLACGILFAGGDLFESGRLTWAWWPLLGWGGGLLLHALRVSRLVRSCRNGPDIEPMPSTGRRPLLEHALLWLVASAIFLVADWHAHGRLAWAHYPILGWGLGLFAQLRSTRRGS